MAILAGYKTLSWCFLAQTSLSLVALALMGVIVVIVRFVERAAERAVFVRQLALFQAKHSGDEWRCSVACCLAFRRSGI